MTPTYDDLSEQVKALTDTLSQLQGGPDQHVRLRTEFQLSAQQARLVALLVNTHRPLSVETIYANVFEQPNGDGPVIASVKVAVCKIRARLAELGAPEPSIPCAYGTSRYYLTTEFRAWLSNRLADDQAVAA